MRYFRPISLATALLWLTCWAGIGCDHTASDPSNGLDNSGNATAPEQKAARLPDIDPQICTEAVNYVNDICQLPAHLFVYDGTCDPYDACDSACILGTDCAALTYGGPLAPSRDFTTCRFLCHADGPGMCRDAESHARLCGLPLDPAWNNDRFCDAAERCAANCALATSCLGLWGQGSDAAAYEQCKQACREASLTRGPAPLERTFCASFPEHPRCQTDAAPEAANYCLIYPRSPACADPNSYCAANSQDPWCASASFQCAADPAATCSSGQTYCASNPDDPRCSPPVVGTRDYCALYPDASECASSTRSTFCDLYPEAPECNTNWPTYCEKYPSDPYCYDEDYFYHHCDYYPDAPECDTVYEPHCVADPYDPICKK